MRKSIRRQLLLWLLIPLLTLSIICSIVAYFLGIELARSIYDRQLLNSADSVAARIKVTNNKLTVDLPAAALAVLRHNYQDEFYFQVISPSGQLISGSDFLPLPPTDVSMKDSSFRSINIKGKELRVACLNVPTPDLSIDHVLIQAAETRNTRKGLANQISLSILMAQLILIFSGAVAIWIGIKRGLLPLAEVERAVETRSPGDLSPLQVEEPIEIVSLIRALNRLLKQLNDDRDSQKRFIANAAHQLRTPLAALGTYSDLALKLAHDSEVSEVLRDLDSGISRMSKMVNRLLALARSEPEVIVSRPGALVDLNQLTSVVSAAQVPEALRKRITLEFSASSEPAMVFGDQSSLEELASNLIENSILYTPNAGKVLVKVATTPDGAASLTISDDGPGIALSARNLIFERFYRIPGTEQQGTGLGLSIVKEITLAHRAEIIVEEGLNNRGVSFTVRFPPPGSRIQDIASDSKSQQKIKAAS